jgi:hypothetical protein
MRLVDLAASPRKYPPTPLIVTERARGPLQRMSLFRLG